DTQSSQMFPYTKHFRSEGRHRRRLRPWRLHLSRPGQGVGGSRARSRPELLRERQAWLVNPNAAAATATVATTATHPLMVRIRTSDRKSTRLNSSHVKMS